MVRLWAHECYRVWWDRFIEEGDREVFLGFMKGACKNFEFKEEQIFEEPNIHTSFITAAKGHEKTYIGIKDMEELRKVLEDKLAEYNENVAQMNLVLFD